MASNAAAFSTGAEYDAHALKRRQVGVDGPNGTTSYDRFELDDKKSQARKVGLLRRRWRIRLVGRLAR